VWIEFRRDPSAASIEEGNGREVGAVLGIAHMLYQTVFRRKCGVVEFVALPAESGPLAVSSGAVPIICRPSFTGGLYSVPLTVTGVHRTQYP
jgi:hypothetical protein